MTVGSESDLEERVCDPCCGSGRFLISMAKEKPKAVLYGSDIDLRCVKMTTLNMWLFDLNAFITCGNALADGWSIGYETRHGGYIREIIPSPTEKPDPAAPPTEAPSAPSPEARGQMDLPL
jgi:N-6 DNA Methylase